MAIIDAADDLNVNAANAVLKTLEEPPSRGVILLVSHSPGRLLPTIRSRCRRLLIAAPSLSLAVEMVEQRAGLSRHEAERLARMAVKFGLTMTAGSDYHGASRPHNVLGRMTDTGQPPIDQIDPWLLEKAISPVH